MTRETDLADINDRAREALVRRATLQREADGLGHQVGALMNLARTHYGQSRLASARAWDIAPATLQDLGAVAARAGVLAEPPTGNVLYLGYAETIRYVTDSGARVDRIVAGAMNLLYVTRAEPLGLAQNGVVPFSELLLHLDDGTWVAVSSSAVTVGYLGSGPQSARGLLMKLGFPEELAERVAYYSSYIDIDPSTGVEKPRPQGALVGGPNPELISHHQQLVGRLGSREFWEDPEPADPLEELDRWLAVMDDPARPPWMDGPRRARVFLSEEASQSHGYVLGSPFTMRDGSSPTIIIEQGRLQLWLAPYPAADPSHYLSDDAYTALDRAKLYPKELARLDAAGKFLKWLRRTESRPEFVDLGDGALSVSPRSLEGE